MALIEDPAFIPFVQTYAKDKDLFFDEFSRTFAKLIELGVNREERVAEAAPKKSDNLGAPGQGTPLPKAKL